MKVFHRTREAEAGTSPAPAQMTFLMPKDVTWTVHDVYRLEMQGELSEALHRWRLLLEPFEDPRASAEVQLLDSCRHIWLHIGKCARGLGLFDEALHAYERARTLASEARDSRALVEAHNGIGVVYRSRGELDRSLAWLELALLGAESLPDLTLVAVARDNYAMTLRMQGLLERALAEEQSARAVVASAPGRVSVDVQARVLANLGLLYLELGRRPEAGPILEEALAKARVAGDSVQEDAILANLSA